MAKHMKINAPEDARDSVTRRGDREPRHQWSPAFVTGLGSWNDEEIERPTSRPITKKQDPFD
jgi:hypothetical protein